MKTLDVLTESVQRVSDFDGEITEQTILPDLMLESLDYVSIQLDIKRHLGIDIDYDDFKAGAIQTVGDFIRYIDAKRSQ